MVTSFANRVWSWPSSDHLTPRPGKNIKEMPAAHYCDSSRETTDKRAICQEEFAIGARVAKLKICGHEYCRDCLAHHIQVTEHENSYRTLRDAILKPVGCPLSAGSAQTPVRFTSGDIEPASVPLSVDELNANGNAFLAELCRENCARGALIDKQIQTGCVHGDQTWEEVCLFVEETSKSRLKEKATTGDKNHRLDSHRRRLFE